MRIAISGTHGAGKSTLIEEFLRVHREFVHEPEPYVVLVEDYGEEFSAEPCGEDFLRQLDFNIERLGQHTAAENVIYERCPIDFLAYLVALDWNSNEALLQQIKNEIHHLDLIVYLPLHGSYGEVEYPKLQRAVDRKLSNIFADETLDVMVVEATGSTAHRLSVIENALQSILN